VIEELVTSNGYLLKVGRVDRRDIDRFYGDNPPPDPPTKTAADLGIEVFGGFEEDELVPIWDDPEYKEQMHLHNLTFWNARLDLVAPALEVVAGMAKPNVEELKDLTELGFELDHANVLRLVVFKEEADAVIAISAVLYNSTVTLMGIREAAKRYAVTWQGKPVITDVPETSPLSSAREFGDRRAAAYCHIPWPEFCELTGPEQSAVVAFHRMDVRINNLTYKTAARTWKRPIRSKSRSRSTARRQTAGHRSRAS
jgi:hypothetical protein